MAHLREEQHLLVGRRRLPEDLQHHQDLAAQPRVEELVLRHGLRRPEQLPPLRLVESVVDVLLVALALECRLQGVMLVVVMLVVVVWWWWW